MFNCMRHKRLYRDHIGCFQGKQNQSLQLGPILNDTKQFHLNKNTLLLTRNLLGALQN